MLHTANGPESSEGEHNRKGTWASAQVYWQHVLKVVGQALALLREHVEVTKVDIGGVVVVVRGWAFRQLQALEILLRTVSKALTLMMGGG